MNQVFISNNRAGQILSAKAWTDMAHLAGGADDGSGTAMLVYGTHLRRYF